MSALFSLYFILHEDSADYVKTVKENNKWYVNGKKLWSFSQKALGGFITAYIDQSRMFPFWIEFHGL